MAKPTKAELTKVRNALIRWRDAYYNTSKPLVSDKKFDDTEDLFRKWAPTDSYFEKVGAPTRTGRKVKLPYEMPSLGKVRQDRGDAAKFLSESSGDIVALDKLDGLSLLYVRKPDYKLYTRGNGTVGQDISFLIPHIGGLGTLDKGQAVRGELLMDSDIFAKKWAEDYENPRNTISGIANSSKVHHAATDAYFIAHELVNPSTPWLTARVKLKGQGFNTCFTKRFKNPTPQQLDDYLQSRKSAASYEMDGLVLIDTRNAASRIAFKKDEDPVLAIVDHIQWNLSSNKLWKPKIILKHPVRIGGVTVKQLTAHNGSQVVRNGLGPNAVFYLIRAGDVIPKIVGVKKKVTPQMPPEGTWKWDAKKVEAIATRLSTEDKQTVKSKILAEGLVTLGLEGFSLGLATKLAAAGYDLMAVLTGTEANFIKTGIGNVNSKKLYTLIQQLKKTVTHDKLMDASNLWPKGFTDTFFQKCLIKIPYGKMMQMDGDLMVEKLSTIKGISDKSATIFESHIDDYDDWYTRLGWQIKGPTAPKVVSGKLSGQIFVFTNFRDKALQAQIESLGGKVSNSVNSSTTMVINGVLTKSSDKVTKAKSLKIPVIGAKEFTLKYMK